MKVSELAKQLGIGYLWCFKLVSKLKQEGVISPGTITGKTGRPCYDLTPADAEIITKYR